MKNLSKPMIFLAVSLAAGIVVLILLIFVRSILQVRPNNLGAQSKLTVKDDAGGKNITFSADGLVTYEDENGKHYETWDTGKISSLFDYIFSNSLNEGGIPVYDENGKLVGYLNPDDELINTIEDEVGGGGGGGDDITQYFATPTPAAGGGSGSGSGGGSGGGGGTGGSGGGGPSWCSYWKLSYCAIVKKLTPSPTLNNQGVIQAQNCDEWSTQTDQQKTVISNEACHRFYASPSPTP